VIGGEHSVRIACSEQELWTFMETFSNWAAYVVGFQSLRQVDDETAVWTLRGDVGILSREVEIEVKLTRSEPGVSASFELTGITERLTGSGSFEVSAEAPSSGPDVDTATPDTPETREPGHRSRPSRWARLRSSFGRWLIGRARRRSGAAPVRSPSVAPPPAGHGAWLTFHLEVQPGGSMAPMVEMLMAPLLEPAAEDLSLQIRQAIEGRSA
jgi:carbon monoxide dehydrogenase subunit G